MSLRTNLATLEIWGLTGVLTYQFYGRDYEMKIVFLSYLHGFGGAEKQIIMLANAMVERGHDVTLISICADNNCYFLDERVKYIFLPDRQKGILRIAGRYQDIKEKLKELRPDATVSFWFQSAYLTAAMPKSITGKVIYSERGDPGDKEYKGFLGIVRKMTLPHIDGFVFQSRGAQKYFNSKVQKRSAVIPNPVFVNAEDFPEVHVRRKAIVTVGRLHPQKNQKLLIDAFAMIASQIPEYTLEIYGDGELKETLQKQINDLNLAERAHLKGTSKQIHKLIYDASLFVLSSDYEGLPNTLLEAMSLGIPSISTDCKPGGAREIIQDGVTGIITPIGDKEKLAEAIMCLLSDKQKGQKMADKARISMSHFTPARVYDKWEKALSCNEW